MKEFLNGNEAVVRAAIRAGCDFFAGYPITPATSILHQMTRELPKAGGIAIQGEDEIASIGFCIGAVLTGKRAMTASSGPGISLYSENIGAAIMVEVPLVIVDVQRMGPATGGPTIGAHGDIQFVRWSSSGGYPIIALSPTDIPECYNFTMRAFDLAERFRCPVFILIDKEIGLTRKAVDCDDLVDFPVRDRLGKVQGGTFPFEPYQLENPTDVPIIPAFGGPDLIRLTTSSHTSTGHLTKDPASISSHNHHLIAKITTYRDEISLVFLDDQPGAETLIISYGITAQSAYEAVQEFRDMGKLISHLIIYSLWPVPQTEICKALVGKTHLLIPELNHGLYRREIERVAMDTQEIHGLNRLDGGLISPGEIIDALRNI
jgi:2-oxoglutarate ferredoxin oxidoreductase subunit alpha